MGFLFNKKKQEAVSSSNKENENLETNFSSGNIKITVSNDSNQEIKSKKKEIFKFVSIIISFVLIILTIICLCFSIANKTYKKNEADSYIILTNSNYTNSRNTYEQFGKENQKKINDYAILGNKLFISESKIVPSSISADKIECWNKTKNNFALWNLSTNTSEYHKTNFLNNKFYIDLSKCEEGDYLIYSQNDSNKVMNYSEVHPYSINSKESINLEFYTLPDEQGNRKKVKIRNNNISPFTIISIVNYGSKLPENYYDIVIFNEEYNSSTLEKVSSLKEDVNNNIKEIIDSINSNSKYKIKYVNTINDAIETNSVLSISLSSTLDNEYSTSVFIDKMNSNILSDGYLSSYDKNPEIRELTGYLDCAGMNYYNVIGNNISSPIDNKIGKEAYILNIQNEIDLNSKIIKFINSI